jgi:hypothetical protein
MENIQVFGSSEELKQVIEFCKGKSISWGILNQETDIDITKVEPIHINMNDIENSERIKPYFIEGKKSGPVYEALVEKYGKDEADKLYSSITKV